MSWREEEQRRKRREREIWEEERVKAKARAFYQSPKTDSQIRREEQVRFAEEQRLIAREQAAFEASERKLRNEAERAAAWKRDQPRREAEMKRRQAETEGRRHTAAARRAAELREFGLFRLLLKKGSQAALLSSLCITAFSQLMSTDHSLSTIIAAFIVSLLLVGMPIFAVSAALNIWKYRRPRNT